MIAVRGRDVRDPLDLAADVVVVGSGPAGAAVARTLARAGADVVVVEEGSPVEVRRRDAFEAMSTLYRDLGASLMMGPAPIPFVQGRAVGGTSVVNGAISWRLPEDVHREWVDADPALAAALPWDRLVALHDRIEQDLRIAPTSPDVAGRNNALLGRGADALGLAHRPIARNVDGCRGLAQCLNGCPEGRKLSMDRSYLPDAARAGARIVCEVRVDAVDADGAARGVVGTALGGGTVRVRARRAIVLAASAVQSPALLLRSGIRHGPTGDGFQCHPGVSMVGRFPDDVRMWDGATQGHEVTGLRAEGIKLEALAYDRAVLALRLPGVGRALAARLAEADRLASWAAAIRARARGTVRPTRTGVRVRFALLPEDVRRLRRGLRVLGELMLAAGAEVVWPGVHGWRPEVRDRAAMAGLETDGPDDPRAFTAVATHLFGTCRMGSDPATSVVRPDFRHHAVDRLYVADSSVFPTNTGVNPQTSILVLATHLAEQLAS